MTSLKRDLYATISRPMNIHPKRRTIVFVCLLNCRFIPYFMVKGFDMEHIIVKNSVNL